MTTTRRTGPSERTRDAVRRRARLRCEVCNGSLDAGLSFHHRIPRGMGGTKRPEANSAANLLLVCGHATTPNGCHQQIESNRSLSVAQGRLLRQGSDPQSEPVLLWDGWWLLTDQGERYPAP